MATLFGGEGSGLVLRSWVEQKVNLDPLGTLPENPFCIRLPRSSSNMNVNRRLIVFLRLTNRDLPKLAPPIEIG
jgi:hypothetical protein